MDEIIAHKGVITIIQARMQSVRLPGKPLLPLGYKTILEHTILRAKKALHTIPFVLACPEGADSNPLRSLADFLDVSYYEGSNEDPLARTLNAARYYEAETVVRICGCDPLIDPKMLAAALSFQMESGRDIVTVGRLPYGTACEVMPLRTLRRLDSILTSSIDRKYYVEYAMVNRNEFDTAFLPAPPKLAFPEIRLRVQTESDYWFVQRLYDTVPPHKDGGMIELEDVIRSLYHQPDLLYQNVESHAIVYRT